MACYHPLPAQKRMDGTVKVYPRRANTEYNPEGFFVPCGQCIGCRLERSRQWAMRIVHEAQLYEDNQFITLTYDEENLPDSRSLNPKDFQDFMKRLRKAFGNNKIRYYHCGEYGEKLKRPHYHAIIFNLKLTDRKIWKQNNGFPIYTSEILNKIWGKGYASTADVSFESAAYVARYVMKKITGKKALEHYTDFDRKTGEIFAERRPEYTTMSRRPGIGKEWLERYKSDVFPHDHVVMRNMEMQPPKYYLSQYEQSDPMEWEKLKEKRKSNMKKNLSENTGERLRTREKVKKAQLKMLKRNLEL